MPLNSSVAALIRGRKFGVAIGVMTERIRKQDPQLAQVLDTLANGLNDVYRTMAQPTALQDLKITDPSTGAAVIELDAGGLITIRNTAGQTVTTLGYTGEPPLSISSATNASPSVLTVSGNGYIDGDTIFVKGALGNTAINGFRIVQNTGVGGADTFTMIDLATGAPVNGNGAYTGSGTAARFYAGFLGQTVAIGPSFDDYRLRAFADGTLKLRNAEITLESPNGAITLDPTEPAVEVRNGAGNLISWMGTEGANIGIWSANLWAGGTGPSNANLKFDQSTGTFEIDGATLTLNINGVTTSIRNSAYPLGTAGLRAEDNTTHYYSAIDPYRFVSSNSVGAELASIGNNGGSGEIQVFTQSGIGAVINTDGVYQIDGETIISKPSLSQVKAANIWSLGDFKAGIAGATGISGTVPLAKLTAGGSDGSLTFQHGIITAVTAPT